MKEAKNKQRKLTKKELKEINGGYEIFCDEGYCLVPGTSDEYRLGLVARNGNCC